MESYIQTMEYCSTLRINELSSHEEIWRKLKYILLSERSQLKTLHTVYSNYVTFWNKIFRGRGGDRAQRTFKVMKIL